MKSQQQNAKNGTKNADAAKHANGTPNGLITISIGWIVRTIAQTTLNIWQGKWRVKNELQ